MKKLNPKICRICGNTFVPKSGRQVKCPDCKNKKVACAECGKIHKPNSTNADGEYICQTCYRNSKDSVDCAICGTPHKPGHTNADGEYICYTCYLNSRDSVDCAICGTPHKPCYTNDDGEYICQTCYRNSRLLEHYNSLRPGERPDFDYLEKIIGIHRKREIECWHTGKSYFHDFICVVIKRAGGKCELTGKKSSNLEVHHLNGYNWCIEGRVDPKNAICIDKAVHKAFHDLYGRGNNTLEQWLEFASNYEKRPVTLDDFY